MAWTLRFLSSLLSNAMLYGLTTAAFLSFMESTHVAAGDRVMIRRTTALVSCNSQLGQYCAAVEPARVEIHTIPVGDLLAIAAHSSADESSGLRTATMPVIQHRVGCPITLCAEQVNRKVEKTSLLDDTPWPNPTLGKGLEIDCGNSVTLELVPISAGCFTMGGDWDADTKPLHKVAITRPFYLGKYEVTQAQWEQVMGNNPSRFDGLRNPVEQVRWLDCVQFCNRLNEKLAARRRGFRLPTEAEWEYACRAGSTTRWSFGDDDGELPKYTWSSRFGNNPDRTGPVGSKAPNRWGLYDMYGNVAEWCNDWYGDHYYAQSPERDPTGPATGTYRVVRGGRYTNDGRDCSSAGRCSWSPRVGDWNLGFRICLLSEWKTSDD